MRSNRQPQVLKGLLAGMIGGLVASWAMNQFQAALKKTEEAWAKSAHRPQKQGQNSPESDSEDSTMKTADWIAELALNRHLTKEQKRKAGPVVHYAYGTLIGGLYGAMAEFAPAVTKGKGTAYGLGAFVAGDEIAVPKLGLSKPPQQQPAKVHVEALAAHIVYGLTTDTIRRGLRAVL
jgi:putative membrane protein